MEIVFWQNMPSHHQSGAIRALSNIWQDKVFGIYDTELLGDRQQLGWQRPNMGAVECTYLDQQTNPGAFVSNFILAHPNAIHILGGFRGCLSVDLAWRVLRKRPDAQLACMAERPRFGGNLQAKLLARIWYRIFFLRFAHRFEALFAMGKLGVECYTSLGFSQDRIFPFIYQVDRSNSTFHPKATSTKDSTLPPQCLKFVYIGRFETYKGVDLILDAFDRLPGKWQLDWIGGGGSLEDKVRSSANGGKINFLGTIPSNQVVTTLQQYDVCLTPSEYDGWGMVTNEALMAGCGVITSSAVGASELITASGAGRVVLAGDLYALRQVLLDVLDRPSQVTDWAIRASAYRHSIEPKIVGQYLHEVLNHVFIDSSSNKPRAPWLVENKNLCVHQ